MNYLTKTVPEISQKKQPTCLNRSEPSPGSGDWSPFWTGNRSAGELVKPGISAPMGFQT